MLKFTVTVPETSVAAIKKAVERKARESVELVALKIYNTIVTGSEGGDYPYYSGSYISSWNIQYSSPDTSYNKPYRNRGYYIAPSPVLGLSGEGNVIYISNYVPHAGQVELEGTPSHPSPWMQAHRAVNDVIGKYRFF